MIRIKCPQCDSELSIKEPKPGKYKPKCKRCGKSFRLQISSAGTASVTLDRRVEETDAATLATLDGTGHLDGTSNRETPSPLASAPRPRVSAKATAGSRSQLEAKEDVDSDAALTRLGGYQIVRMLGRGAMGTVYEAKQTSLDRLVALKTVRDRVAKNPLSLARFTREAYAAAQLNHHNVVQVYDFGEDAGKHFFSMEWVKGGPLDQLVKSKGQLDPRLAAGYLLQAARGLLVAHDQGMVHRDIKPANLLLTDDGVVKVADLGLVKVPDVADLVPDGPASNANDGTSSGTEITMQGTAVGTPAYMSPEQGINAASVDHRADIYSLGCTLFYLLTGQPPFGGSDVSEVMHQHASVLPPKVTEVNGRIPASLESIIDRCLQKKPGDRYPNLAEMIGDLESFLGVDTDGTFSPSSSQADQIESITQQFTDATKQQQIGGLCIPLLMLVAIGLTLITLLLAPRWVLLGASVFFAATATAIGLTGKRSEVYLQCRRWIDSLRWMDWAIAGLAIAASLLVLFFLGLWIAALLGGIIGAAIGAAFHFGFSLPMDRRSEPAIESGRKFVRDLRIDGADESEIRDFVARYAVPKWQAIFERIFGYQATQKMRTRLATDASFQGDASTRFLRDRACEALSERADSNRKRLDHLRLTKIEERGLQSEGLSEREAKDRAWQMASALMEVSKQAVSTSDSPIDVAAEVRRARMKAMLLDARSGKYKVKRDKFSVLRFAMGGQTRLLAGCLLLAVFAIWGRNQGLFHSLAGIESIQDLTKGGASLDAVRELATSIEANQSQASVLGGSYNAWSIGISGLLLVLSAFVSGWRMTPFAIVATLVILLGETLGVPAIGSYAPAWLVAAGIGLAIYLPGIVFGEKKDFA